MQLYKEAKNTTKCVIENELRSSERTNDENYEKRTHIPPAPLGGSTTTTLPGVEPAENKKSTFKYTAH